MMLKAVLACGACHISMVNSRYSIETAQRYYDEATGMLLKTLIIPQRNLSLCTLAALILNVYETMTERALQKMNHIAGARALVRECGWDAESVGIAAACFWLNVTTEILNCVLYKWSLAWHVEAWNYGLHDQIQAGKVIYLRTREDWAHAAVYILARAVDFWALQHYKTEESHVSLEAWEKLNQIRAWWQVSCPPDFQGLTSGGSLIEKASSFPEIW